jgi:reactive intermediate/imine deaminase
MKLNRLLFVLLAAAMLNAACQPASPPPETKMSDVQYLNMPGTEDLGLPFSSAVRVDHTLYLSGNLGNLPGSIELAPGGIGPETRQTMENIRTVLEQFGSSMDKVVKCTVFLADIKEWAAMNEVYRTYFKDPPARSALGASGLALNARVEIECIATVD